MNAKVLFSSKDMSWSTPQAFFDKLNAEFKFTLDPCCTHETAKCEKHYTEKEDGLSQSWQGETVFCNPPYGDFTKFWVKKAYEESRGDCTVVLLVPCRPDVSWFHDYILGKAGVRFIRGRLKFGGCNNSAPFPSMVVVFSKFGSAPKDKGSRGWGDTKSAVHAPNNGKASDLPCPRCDDWVMYKYCPFCGFALNEKFPVV